MSNTGPKSRLTDATERPIREEKGWMDEFNWTINGHLGHLIAERDLSALFN
jgi:hypothetical protein